MKIKVLVWVKVRTIEANVLNGKIHKHISGRDFSSEELNILAPTKTPIKETKIFSKKK